MVDVLSTEPVMSPYQSQYIHSLRASNPALFLRLSCALSDILGRIQESVSKVCMIDCATRRAPAMGDVGASP